MKQIFRLMISIILSLLLVFGVAQVSSYVYANPDETSSEETTDESSVEETTTLSEEEIASSIFESIEAEESKKEEEEKAAFEKAHVQVGNYYIKKNLKGIEPPVGYELANDLTNFESAVDIFYHDSFNVVLYYATEEQEGEYGLYIYSALNQKLIPFMTISVDGETFVVVTPSSLDEIPGQLISETTLKIGSYTSNNMYIPAYKIFDAEKNPIFVVDLQGSNSFSHFYVYDDSSAYAKFVLYEDYEKAQGYTQAQTTKSTTSVSTTTVKITVAKTTQTSVEDDIFSAFGDAFIWVIVLGAVLLFLVIAIIFVVMMNKKQASQEDEIDLSKEDFGTPIENLKKKRMMSGDYNNEQEDIESFDTSFDNSFPEEMHVKEVKSTEDMNDIFDVEDQETLTVVEPEEEADNKQTKVSEDTMQVDFELVRQETSRFKQEESKIKKDDFEEIDF